MKGRVWVQVVIVLIGIYMSVALVRGLLDLYKAQERMDVAQQKLIEAKKQNEELKQRLAETQTPEFIEKAARDELNLQRPGEVVVVMPMGRVSGGENREAEEPEKKNWEKWWELFK